MENSDFNSKNVKRAKVVTSVIFVSLGIFFLFSILFSVLELPSPFWFSYCGELLFTAYGYSSFLISCFLLVATIVLLVPGWSVKSGIMLVFSIVPFFTMVEAEKIIREIPDSYLVKILSRTGVFAIAVLLIIAEYLCVYFLIKAFSSLKKQTKPKIIDSEKTIEESDKNLTRSLETLKNIATEAMPVKEKPFNSQEDDLKNDDFQENNFHEDETIEISKEEYSEIQHYEDFLSQDEVVDVFSNEPTDVENLVADLEKDEFEPVDPFESPNDDDSAMFDLNATIDQDANAELDATIDQDANAEPDATIDQDANAELDATIDQDANTEPDASIDQDANAELDVDAIPDSSRVAEYEAILLGSGTKSKLLDSEDNDAEEEQKNEEETDNEFFDDTLDDDFEEENTNENLSLEEDEFEENTDEDADEETPKLKPEEKNSLPTVSVPKKRKNYSVPIEDLLTSYPDGQYWIIDDASRDAAVVLKQTLSEFKIQAEVTGIRKGPVITMFEILPAPGVKLQKIVALQDNIALRLAASSIRIIAPIPGKHAVGIEIPNEQRAIVSFKELIETEPTSAKKMEIPVVLGKDITGEAIYLDLATTPHLLIAGSTGAGKSVCVNSMILSMLYKRSPAEIRMILIDPKIVELKLYNDIPHLLTPVITESKKAFQALQYCICEMERRYALLDGMGVRDIKSYNRRIKEREIATEKLPYIVVIIDEFADLMATTGKELESTVARLCAMSRAVGIHLVLATQRPSIDVITGLIKANIPSRIAFMVASKMDSRIIIDQVGAEKLLGKGDMLYASATDPFPVRIQGAFVTDNEVEKVAAYVRQYGEPEYIDEEIFFDDEEGDVSPSLFSDGEDPLYEKALDIVMQAGKASASYIQRRLKIGYNRAARLVEDMEARGIVGPPNGSKPREVIHHV